MHETTYPLRIFWKIIYKLDNTIDPKMQYKIIEADKFEPTNGILIVGARKIYIYISTYWG